MNRPKNQAKVPDGLFSRTASLDRALLCLAQDEPEIYEGLRQVGKEAAKWKSLPKGWTQKSVDKFWGTLTGDVKHKVTKCIKEMKGDVDDPGAFCASLADKVEGPEWRSRRARGQKTAGQVANTIAEQMGGVRRLRAMLGAQVMALSGDKGLGIKWPNKQRSKGNYVEIIYNRGQDLYDMTFYNLTIRAKKKVKEYRGVYADQLGELFEKQTGWYLRLGRQKSALNKYNAPEVLAALMKALQVAGLAETVDELKRMRVPRMINDAWMHREKTAARVASRWLANREQ